MKRAIAQRPQTNEDGDDKEEDKKRRLKGRRGVKVSEQGAGPAASKKSP